MSSAIRFSLHLLVMIPWACSEAKPKTPTASTTLNQEEQSPASDQSDNTASGDQIKRTQDQSSANIQNPATNNSPGTPTNAGGQPPKVCPPFPNISSPVNGGGGNCSDACVRRLKDAYQYLTALGSTLSKPTDKSLKQTPSVARSFFKELNTEGKNRGCNPFEGKNYQ